MEIDTFGVGGGDRKTFYPESTKFFKLQKENFVLNNVLNKIASKFSSAEFLSETDNNELVDKINNPNEKQSKEEFLKEFAIYLLSSGYTIMWKKYVSYGNFKTMELINLNPDKTEFTKDGVSSEVDNKIEKILIADVIVFYDSIRNNETKKGYSRITPLRSQINNIRDAQIAKGIQIENSGTTIVSPKAAVNGNSVDEGLNAAVPVMGGGMKTQKEEMEERFNTRGISNRIIVSNKGLDAKNLSSELNNVKFYEIVETDILAVYDTYNFPVELSPYGKNATFENKETAEVSLIETEAYPLAKNLYRSLNSAFPNKKPISDVSYDHLNSMSIIEKRIQETNGTAIDQLKTLYDSELITKDEFRKELKSKKVIS
jgi:hypothetical protein